MAGQQQQATTGPSAKEEARPLEARAEMKAAPPAGYEESMPKREPGECWSMKGGLGVRVGGTPVAGWRRIQAVAA